MTTPDPERSALLEALYEEGRRGRHSDAALHPSDGTWGDALRLQRWLAGVEPELPRVSIGAKAAPAAKAALATEALRGALLAFDGAGVDEAARWLPASTAPLAIRVGLAEAWADWVRASPSSARVAALGQKARECADASGAVEAQVLRGLHEIAEGKVSDAVRSLRRASRMARVEGVPDLEVLAGVALARGRRFQGRPQLALRILRAVSPHAPPVWNRWISWEAALAGARFSSGRADPSLLSSLLRACDASEAGEARAAAEADALLRRNAELFPVFRREATSAAALLSVLPAEAPADVSRWIAGVDAEVPPAFRGFVFARYIQENGESCALLVAHPKGLRRRILARSVHVAIAYGADALAAEAPTRPRTDSGLATLAFSPEDLSLRSYFESVYEYTFDSGVHRSMLNMHVKRMRERLGDAAQIERDGDTIALRLSRAVILRDARCEETLEDRVLGVLAESGAQSAADLARQLKIPLRTVQRILKELQVEAGVEQRKEGRQVRYVVEDTTFSEPTRTRRFETGLV